MHKPEIINVLKNPDSLSPGDIIGFNQFPGHSRAQVKGSSGLSLQQFSATVQEPSFRGYVLGPLYDKNLQVGILVMPLAPIAKSERIPNDDKNLMISRKRQHDAMGLSHTVNWRLNYMPIEFDLLTPKNFAVRENGGIVKFGSVDPDLQAAIFDHVQKLLHKGILHSANFLPDDTARLLRGREIAGYDRLIGAETGIAIHGNSRDAQTAAEAEARAAREKSKNNKINKADAARALRAEMRSSPSGRVAYDLGLRFREQEKPDLSLANAFEYDLIDEDTFLILDEMAFKTLRTVFDAFHNDRADFFEKLADVGTSNAHKEQFKETVAVDLKAALTSFYRHLQKEKTPLQPHIIPYAAAPIEPAIEKPVAPERPNIAEMSLSDAFDQGIIRHSTREFLKDAIVPGTQKAPETMGDAFKIVTEAPESLKAIYGLQSRNSVTRERIITEVTAAISPPEPA